MQIFLELSFGKLFFAISMLNLKIQSQFTKFFVAALLTIFVVGKSFLLVHSFAHNFSAEKSSHQNCEICALANFQKQTAPTPNFSFAAAIFLVIFLAQKLVPFQNFSSPSPYFSQAPPRF
jgi:hypothetical protein